MADALAAAVAGVRAQNAPGRIAGELVATVAALRESELLWRILELDPELLLPYLLARRGRSQQAIVDRLVDEIEAGQAAGEIRAGDPRPWPAPWCSPRTAS
ncbi:MAG: hypothetical protein R2731_19705 [Nocardioides sp.]